MGDKEKQQKETHERVKKKEEEMMDVAKNIPEKCKTMRF